MKSPKQASREAARARRREYRRRRDAARADPSIENLLSYIYRREDAWAKEISEDLELL
jgi:hypothetical protein